MTLRESMQLYCNQHDECDGCPLKTPCFKSSDPDDNDVYPANMDEGCFTSFVHEAKMVAEQILYYINLADKG